MVRNKLRLHENGCNADSPTYDFRSVGFGLSTALEGDESRGHIYVGLALNSIAAAISSTRKMGSNTGGTSHSRRLNEEDFNI